MPEIGLGIGRDRGLYENWQREWLNWYDSSGQRHTTLEELVQQERQQKELAQERAETLAAFLRQQGLDPTAWVNLYPVLRGLGWPSARSAALPYKSWGYRQHWRHRRIRDRAGCPPVE